MELKTKHAQKEQINICLLEAISRPHHASYAVVSPTCLSVRLRKRIWGVDKEVKQSLDVEINAVQHRDLDAREKTLLSPILLCVLQGDVRAAPEAIL